MTPTEKSTLLALTTEWQQIATKCSAVADRHRAKGEKLQYVESMAFATARRACAEELKKVAGEIP